MAFNEYDEMLSTGNVAAGNEYDQLLGSDRDVQKTALQQSAFIASQGDPDLKARAVELSKRTNLPVSFVEKNYDQIAKKTEIQSSDYDAIIDKTPGLAKWLENPDNATLAKDDFESLSKIESTVKDHTMMSETYSALQSGLANLYSSAAKVPALAYDTAAIPQNLLYEAIGSDTRVRSPEWLRDNPIAQRYDEAAKSFSTPSMESSVTDEISKGNYSGAGRALAVQFVANAPQQAALLLSMLTGAGEAGLIAAGATTAATANAENQAKGIDPVVGVGNALAKGSIESAFESLGTFGILKNWEGVIAKSFGKQASSEVMKDFAKTIAYSIAGESNEEFMTSVAQDFTDYVTGVNPDALSGIGQRALDAGIIGGFSGGLMTGPSAIGMGVHRAQQVKEANRTRDFYLALGESSQSTKLKDRLPEAQQSLIQQITQGTPLENIYLSVDAVESYFQSKNVSPTSAMQEIGILQSYNEAKETGANIEVPISQWATKIVGTEHYQALANDIKFSPDALSVNEHAQVEKETKDEIQKAEAEAKASEDALNLEKKKEASKKIQENIKTQLVDAGFKPALADTYAQVFGERYAARAEQRGLGEDPFELFSKMGLEINKIEDPEQRSLLGKIVDTAKKTFGIAPPPPANEMPFDTSAAMRVERNSEGKIEYDAGTVQYLRRAIQQSEAGSRGVGENGQAFSQGSTFPESFKDRGWTKKEALNVIDKQMSGKTLTDKQSAMLDQMYEGIVDEANRGVFYQSQNDRPFQTEISYPEKVKVGVFDKTGLSTDEAREFFEKNIQGKSVSNLMTGWNIQFPAKAKKKAGSSISSLGNMAAYLNLDSIMSEAILARTELDRRGGADKMHVFYAPFIVEDREYIASVKVRETADGQKVYDKFALEKEKPTLSVGNGDSLAKPTPSPAEININDFIQDVKNLQISDPYFQGTQEAPRGRIRFKPGLMAAIDLFQHSDMSTIIHESGHLWFEEMIQDATTEGVPDQLRKDLDTILKWVGVDVRVKDGESAIRAAIKTEHHEQMARGIEAYMMEGKAPTAALRKAFARFKIWLTNIYQKIGNLNVILDNDVRGVMDRLIAGDNAIARAESEQNYQPLINDAALAGMNEVQAEKYRQAVAEARAYSEDVVRDKLLSDLKKQDETFYKEKKAALKEEITKELQGKREYKALYYLQKGTMPDGSPLPDGSAPLKISKSSLNSFGDDISKQLPKGVTSNDGDHVELIAELLGYGSAQDLIESLKTTAPIKEAVKSLVESQMAELYPDSFVDGTISDEAVKAVHNDKRAAMLRLELEYLANNNMPVLKDAIRRVARRVPTEEMIRKQASEIIGSKKVSEIKPHVFRMAEIKAAKEAGVKLAKGDIDGAFLSKRQELLNHELYRSAVEAKERVESDSKKLKKLFKKDEDIAKTRDVDMVNAGRAILAQFGLTSTDKTAEEYLAPIKAYDPDTYSTVMAMVESATQGSGNYKSIKFDDFVAMSDAVQAIWDLAKSSREMEIDGIKMDRNVIKSELIQAVDGMSSPGDRAGYKKSVSDLEKTKMGLLGLKARLRRVEHWARAMDRGDINGSFTKYIVRPIINATTKYRLAKVDTLKELSDITKLLEKNDKKVIDASEIAYQFKDKSELLAAILHTGNESNLSKLLKGRGWGSNLESGDLDTNRWNKFVERMWSEGILNKSDYDFVQKVWDLNERLKPDAQKAHKKMYGYYFNEITSKEIVTPFGTYRGGYMPAIADSYASESAAIREDKNALEKDNNSYMFPTAGRGFTKSRVESYVTPLSLDLQKIPSHIDKVLRFTHIEPSVKEVGRLVMDRGFRSSLSGFDSEVASEMLVPWLQRAALQTSSQPSEGRGGKLFDRIANGIRKRAGMQIMVLNATNAIQNFTSIFPALTRVNAKNLASSFYSYAKGSNKMATDVADRSEYMKSRIGQNAHNILKEIEDVTLNPSKFEKTKDAIISHGYILEKSTQGVMEVVVWSAAYDQAIASGSTEADAINQADATVRQTQSGMNPEDISRMETGNSFQRLFTMFSTYFNNMGNLLGTEMTIAKDLGFTSKEGSARAFKAYAMVVMAPSIVAAIIGRLMAGVGLDDDDDGEYLDDALEIFFGSQFRMMTAMVPGGAIANSIANSFNDKPYDDRINISPVFSMIEQSTKSFSTVPAAMTGEGDASKAIRDGMTAIGMITGIPTGPISKPASYIADVSEGNADPSGPIDYARGLVTGKRGKQ